MKRLRKNASAWIGAAGVFCSAFVGDIVAATSADPIIIPFKRFGLEWSTELPEQIDQLRVWYSLDNGSTWQLYSETDHPSSPAPVKVSEDGRYGFYTQARDTSGLEENGPVPGTPPKVLAIIDTLKPALVLVTPNSAETFSNTQDLRIQWNASDINFGATPISLYVSKDGGGTWETIKKDLPNTGTYVWKLPAESSEYYKVKVVSVDLAGNESEDISDASFRVDGKAPVTRVTGPADAKSPIFDVTYNASDLGGAGLAKIQIYFQIDGDKTWHLFGEDKDLQSPFRFEAKRGGRYGFKLVGTDRVGNSEPVPDASTRPDIWCLMDSVKPVVQLSNFKGSNITPAGATKVIEIQWVATDDNMAQSPITIELSMNDGATWEKVIVTDFQNSGKFPWTVPSGVNVNRAKLRITALDVLGNKGMDISDAFVIDGKAPKSIVNIVTWNDDTQMHSIGQPSTNMKMVDPNATAPKASVSELITSAFQALKNEDLYTAETLANQALSTDPDNYQVHALLGRLYFMKNSVKKAESAYARSVELNTSYQASRIGLAVTYYTQGQEIFSQDPAAAKELFKKAALQYEASIQIPDDTWDEFFNLGYIYARLQRYEDAIIYLEKAAKLSSDNGDAYWFLGQVHEKLQQAEKALDSYKAAAKAYPAGSTNAQKAEYKVKELSK
jgi:Flp pilus assembly protein TadD